MKRHVDLKKSGSAGSNSAHEHGTLLDFLIRRSLKNAALATYLHWYLLAELGSEENQTQNESGTGYNFVQARQTFMDAMEQKPPIMKAITEQINLRRKLLWALRAAKSAKRDKIENKIAKFQEALSGKNVILEDGSEGNIGKNFDVNNLHGIPMIVDPTKQLLRIVPAQCFLMKSAMYPAVVHCQLRDGATSDVIEKKYMIKEGDDLRQDQLVLQMIILMDSILKKYGLDLRLTPYQVVAASTVDGFVEFVPNSHNVASILQAHDNDLLQFFKECSRARGYKPQA